MVNIALRPWGYCILEVSHLIVRYNNHDTQVLTGTIEDSLQWKHVDDRMLYFSWDISKNSVSLKNEETAKKVYLEVLARQKH